MGPPNTVVTLKKALAVGLTRQYCSATGLSAGGYISTSRVLAEAITKLNHRKKSPSSFAASRRLTATRPRLGPALPAG